MKINHSYLKCQDKKKPCVYVLALGGTIGSCSKESGDEFYGRSSTDISSLISSLPLEKEGIAILSEQMTQQISHDMTNEDLLRLARKINILVNDDNIDGVVISQGTNGIEEAAYFVSLVIQTKKTIVFTGSFRPLNALEYDGYSNLYNAILIAGNMELSGIGVVTTFNNTIVSARYSSKVNPSIIGDFSISGSGIIGYIHSSALDLQNLPNHRHTHLSEFNVNDILCIQKIYVIYGHLGMDSAFVQAAIENNAKGIISAGMGKGYQSKEVTESLFGASQKGIVVVRCSRTGQGIINRDKKMDDEHGIIAGGSLSPHKARILLAVALSKTENNRLSSSL